MAFKCVISQVTSKYISLNIARNYSSSSKLIGKRGLVLGVYTDDKAEEAKLTPAAEHFNKEVNGKLLELLKSCGPVPRKGKTRVLFGLPGFNAVAVTGLGKHGLGFNDLEEIDEGLEAIRSAAAAGCRSLQDLEVGEVQIDPLGSVEAAAEGAALGIWKYQGPKQKPDTRKLLKLCLYHSSDNEQWESGLMKAKAQNFARRLMDTPANLMTPTIFAKEAVDKLGALGVKVTVHDKAWAEENKMGAFLSVTRGSAEPPKFLDMKYNGGTADQKPIVLVGKGITFDSGGISIKPSAKMDAMRADMGGAANVVAVLHAVAQLKLPVNVRGLVPLCENMPSSTATKPGDVVTAMNGKTITVDNTDAEGRLVLADALCIANKDPARVIIDIATLTGAMIVCLGGAATGCFTNSSDMWEQMKKAGGITGDRVWRFPLWNYYTKQVSGADMPSSDLNNIGKGTGGGSCTAAAFLREFAGPGPWMHLDIASVMSSDGSDPSYVGKGMAGRPVRTLVQFITQLAKSN